MLSYLSNKFGSKSTSDNSPPQSSTDKDDQIDNCLSDRSCLDDTDYNKEMANDKGKPIQDEDQGEIIFCKNNIRARLPYCGEVVNGYITLRSCCQERHLMFRWLPNELMLDTPLHQHQVDYDAKPIFEVDTRRIKAIKIFLDNDTFYSGRLVLKSVQNQYKVFHFQHGGLDRLCKVFDSWHSCVTLLSSSPELNTRHYDICTPDGDIIKLRLPYRKKIDRQVWHGLFDSHGRLIKKTQFKEAVFFGGIDEDMRKEAWKFVLGYYSFDSTFEQRQKLKLQRTNIYENIDKRRQSISGEEQKNFYRKVECIVDKDVVRTDRSSEYYAGADNPHVQILRRILLNYAIDNPVVGYTQGMSDLLAPLLVIMNNEIDAYWCFIGLMEKSVFLNTPQNDMEEQLGLLRELLRTLLPHFYAHCMKFLNGIELLFCHRWLLLCFRREVGEYQAQRIWEASWSQHHTSYFHLFLCTAAIALYSDAVIEKNLSPDLTLLHFTSIQEMDGDLLLNKAQELLYEFLVQDIIPCSLIKILSDPGDWDSPPTPTIYCKCDGFHANTGIPTLLDVVHSRSSQDDKNIENNCPEVPSESVQATQLMDNIAKLDLNSSKNTPELEGNTVMRDETSRDTIDEKYTNSHLTDDDKTFVTNPNNIAVELDHEANKEATKTSEDEAVNILSSTPPNNTVDSTVTSTVCENVNLTSDSAKESITEGGDSPREVENIMEVSRLDVEDVTENCNVGVSSSSITRLEAEKTEEADSTREIESIKEVSKSGVENVRESCDVDVNSSSITSLEPEKTEEADSTREVESIKEASRSDIEDVRESCDVDGNPSSTTRLESEETEGAEEKQIVDDNL